MTIIDVSRWQGLIDWRRVRAEGGVTCAIIRCTMGLVVSPRFVSDYFTNGVSSDAKLAGKGRQCPVLRNIQCPNLRHLGRRKFGIAISLSTRRPGATFDHLVVYIVLIGSKKQVIRVTARGVVALMKNLLTNGDVSISQRPSYPMGYICFVSTDANATVSLAPFSAKPKPTFSNNSSSNVLPKTVSNVNGQGFVVTGATTVAAQPIPNINRSGMKRRVAYFADSVEGGRLGEHWKLILSSVGHILFPQSVAVCVVPSV